MHKRERERGRKNNKLNQPKRPPKKLFDSLRQQPRMAPVLPRGYRRRWVSLLPILAMMM
jgi:hypothetical protein